MCSVCNAINGCLSAQNALKAQPQPVYWLYSLVMSYLSAFGGGTVAPVLIGRPSFVLNNDFAIFACICVWYVVNHLNGTVLFNHPVVKMFWLLMLAIFRANAATNMVTVASGIFTPTKYYPIPILGPIVVGTLLGCLGQFLPFDKGLSPIKNNTPWPVQAAFLTSTFYHLMINDKTGFLGVGLRRMIGSYSPSTVLVIIATVQVTQFYAQYFFHPDANLFKPFNELGYLIFQVQGPRPSVASAPVTPVTIEKPGEYVGWNMRIRERLQWVLAVGRVVVVLATLSCHIFVMVVPTHLTAAPFISETLSPTVAQPFARVFVPELQQVVPLVHNASMSWPRYNQAIRRHALPVHHSIGVCQFFVGSFRVSSLAGRQCPPFFMKFEQVAGADANEPLASFRLAVYEKNINKLVWDHAVADITPLYTSPVLHVAKKHLMNPLSESDVHLVLDSRGRLSVVFTAPKIDTTTMFKWPNSQFVSLQSVPWLQLETAQKAGDSSAVSGQLLPFVGVSAGGAEDRDLAILVDQYAQEYAKLSSTIATKNTAAVTKKLNELDAKINAALETAAQEATSTANAAAVRAVSYVTIDVPQGRVVAHSEPTISSKLATLLLETVPQTVVGLPLQVYRDWNRFLDASLSRDAPLTLNPFSQAAKIVNSEL